MQDGGIAGTGHMWRVASLLKVAVTPNLVMGRLSLEFQVQN